MRPMRMAGFLVRKNPVDAARLGIPETASQIRIRSYHW